MYWCVCEAMLVYVRAITLHIFVDVSSDHNLMTDEQSFEF